MNYPYCSGLGRLNCQYPPFRLMQAHHAGMPLGCIYTGIKP